MNGTVARMKKSAGFGFIRPEGNTDGKNDYFFHRGGVASDSGKTFDQIEEGDRVTFENEPSPKGLRGNNVRTA